MGQSQGTLKNPQSYPSLTKAKPGEGVPRILAQGKMPPTKAKYEGCDSIPKMFARAAGLYPENNLFGTRVKLDDGSFGPFEWISYKQGYESMLKVCSAVAGIGFGKGATFGLYASNSSAWQIAGMGCFFRGMTAVPIYDTLGDNIVQYEVNHAEIPLIFVDANKLGNVASVIKDCPSLKYIVQLQPLATHPAKSAAAFQEAGVTLTDLDSVMAAGAAAPVAPTPADGDDLAFIMYTSGTTGDPKGVCIRQLSITIGSSWLAGIELFPTDRYLSYLPLAHIFETMVEHGVMSVGGSIGFFNGNIKLIQDDILTLKPTIFVGVPRVYLRFYEAAHSKIDAMPGPIKKLLLHALETETEAVKTGGKTLWGPVLAKLLGAKITGGAVRIMISGAAPLPSYVHEFLLAAIGCTVLQGYGMTENCANATLMDMSDWRGGHVGPPMPTVEVKLVDVPEMNYTTVDNNSGEVCTRGEVTFAKYYKNPEETAKTIDADGWLHTGDIGRWNADGTLSIIDRKKNIFKLSQGEYVAAEKIEMALGKSKYISQMWAYGNSFLPMLVAVVVPAFAELKAAAVAGGWYQEGMDYKAMAAHPECKALIKAEIASESKAAKLKSFEVPKDFICEGEINELMQGFSIDNDCLTPTFKLKRPQLLKRYQSQVDAMYVGLGEDPSAARK